MHYGCLMGMAKLHLYTEASYVNTGKKAGKWGAEKKKMGVQWCFADALGGGLLQNCLSGVRDFTFSNVKFLVPGSFRISMHQHDPYR